jgi:hypothetical protein
MLDFRDTLPQDIVPLLVLDASARVRETYSLWEDQRGGLVRLPPAPKSYAPLTIHVWQTSGGKDAFRKNGDELVEGIANTIKTKPTERWLVVYHKGIGREIDRDVMSLLPGVDADAVRFLNWGAHEATNAYADIPNVILAGTLFYGSAFYEALGRAAAGRPSEDGPFSTEAYQAVMRGEHRHLILQALCRGVVRKCRGNVCPKSDAYIIASVRSGIAQELPAIFPGARMVRWKPVARKLSGKVGAAAAFVIDAINSGTEHVSFAAVRKHVAITNTSNFNKVVRRHSSFVEALAERGIAEWPKVRPTGFRNEHDAYFGTTTDKEPSP